MARERSLLVVTGPRAGVRYALDRPVMSIGRSSSSEIQLPDEAVGRKHVELRLDPSQAEQEYEAIDQGSANGSLVNGTKLTKKRLSAGDALTVGSTTFIYEPALDYLRGPGPGGSDVILDEATLEVDASRAVASEAESEAQADDDGTAGLLLDLVARAVERPSEDLLTRALALVAGRFSAERAFILRAGPDGKPDKVVRSFGAGPIVVSRTVIQRVLGEGQALVSGDAAGELTLKGGVSLLAGEIRSLLAAPLLVDERPLGLIHLDRRSRHAYAQADLDRFVSVSRVMSLVLLASDGLELLKKQARRRNLIEAPIVIGESPIMRSLIEQAKKAGRTRSNVLLLGETGTGKEVLARLIHAESDRADGPFVAVNCGALPENLQESELFGHELGAFTGASKEKPGLFEVASGGTLFLDELGETSNATQVKLLRALQEQIFFRVGGTAPREVDVRVIAAASRPTPDLIREGKLREDLYFRLAVISLEIPPLRARREDVAPLCKAFVADLCRAAGVPEKQLAPEVIEHLASRAHPGNVRELRNTIERLVILSEGPAIGIGDLPADLFFDEGEAKRAAASGETLAEVIERVERAMVLRAMARTGGVKVAAAQALGISRVTLDAKLKAFGISDKNFRPRHSGE